MSMLALVAASAASAHPDGALSVHNTFDGEVEVWLDGRWMARVPGDGRAQVPAMPGAHEVTVRRAGSGAVLEHERVVVHPHGVTPVTVDAPQAPLRIENQGEIAVRLDVAGQQVWLAPGQVVDLRVTAGTVPVVARAHEPRGDFHVVDRAIWVEPGRANVEVIRPDPTVVAVRNHGVGPVQVRIDGRYAATVAGGDHQRIWIRPGATEIVVLDAYGRVQSHTRAVLAAGAEQRVTVGSAPRPTDRYVWTW